MGRCGHDIFLKNEKRENIKRKPNILTSCITLWARAAFVLRSFSIVRDMVLSVFINSGCSLTTVINILPGMAADWTFTFRVWNVTSHFDCVAQFPRLLVSPVVCLFLSYLCKLWDKWHCVETSSIHFFGEEAALNVFSFYLCSTPVNWPVDDLHCPDVCDWSHHLLCLKASLTRVDL